MTNIKVVYIFRSSNQDENECNKLYDKIAYYITRNQNGNFGGFVCTYLVAQWRKTATVT